MPTRRYFLSGVVAAPVLLPNLGRSVEFPGQLPLTPACRDDDDLTPTCQPVATALVELWHADETGIYDTNGYKLRGHQFTDVEGRWWFNTIVPGLYPGRTRPYHLKIQRPGGRVLTTQLYFPNEPRNDRDGIFDAALLLDIATTSDGKVGRYDFVVA